MAERATNSELALRVAAIRQLILNGASRYDIAQFSAKNWNVKHRQAEEYTTLARVSIREAVNKNRDEYLAEHIEHRRALRHKISGTKNYKLELEVAKDEAKLLDLYPAERHELGGKDGGEITLRVIYDNGTGTTDADNTGHPPTEAA